MTPPPNTPTFESEVFTYWIEDNKVVSSIIKPEQRTIANSIELLEILKGLTEKGNKMCLLTDVSNAKPLTREVQEFLNSELPKYVQAMSTFSSTKTGMGMVFIYSTLMKSPFPIYMAENEEKAREWLKQYL